MINIQVDYLGFIILPNTRVAFLTLSCYCQNENSPDTSMIFFSLRAQLHKKTYAGISHTPHKRDICATITTY